MTDTEKFIRECEEVQDRFKERFQEWVTLEEWEMTAALDAIGEKMPIPSTIADKLDDAVEEWANDNEVDSSIIYDAFDTEDLFYIATNRY